MFQSIKINLKSIDNRALTITFLNKKSLKYYYLLIFMGLGCSGISNDPVEKTEINPTKAAEYVLTNVSGRSAETHYIRAKAHLELGQLDDAEKELTTEIMQRSVDARYSFLLGKVSFLKGDFQQAQKQLRDALELGFNQPEIFQLLTHTYIQLGYTSRALATTDRLLALDKTPENEGLKGTVLLTLGDTAQALEFINRSMRQDSSIQSNYYGLLNVYTRRNKLNEASGLIAGYLKRYPGDEQMLVRKGELYLQQESYAEARDVYDNLIQLNPRNPYYLQQQSKSYFLEGKYDSALIQARRALVLDETDMETRVIVARSLENERLFDEAKEAYNGILASDSTIIAAKEGLERILRRENYQRYLREQERRQQEIKMPDLTPINPLDDQ